MHQHAVKMSAVDMKLDDLEHELDDADFYSELSGFYVKPATTPGESSLPQPDSGSDGRTSTPSSVPPQPAASPSSDQDPSKSIYARSSSAITPSASTAATMTTTPSAVLSPIFSPGATQGTAAPTPQNQTDSVAGTPHAGPLPSEKHIRPTIYSPLNISPVAAITPMFSPLPLSGASLITQGASKPPLTPGSDAGQTEDESSDSSDDDNDAPRLPPLGLADLNALESDFNSPEVIQQQRASFLRTFNAPASSSPLASLPLLRSPSTPQQATEELLYVLRQQALGTCGPLLATNTPSKDTGVRWSPFRTTSSQEVAFQTLLQLQAMLGSLPTDSGKRSFPTPLTFAQLAEAIDLENHSSQYDKNPLFRRKRKTEPKVEALPPPDVLVGLDDSWLKTSAAALPMWEKASLAPYSSAKTVKYYTLHPRQQHLLEHLVSFLRDLESMYELCQLGSHKQGPVLSSSPRNALGEVSLDSVLLTMADEDKEQEIRNAYLSAALSLGNALQTNSLSLSQEGTFVVIYVVPPFLGGDSCVFISEIFAKLLSNIKHPVLRSQVILQEIPIEYLLGNHPQSLGVAATIKTVAFSVYNKCRPLLVKTLIFLPPPPPPLFLTLFS